MWEVGYFPGVKAISEYVNEDMGEFVRINERIQWERPVPTFLFSGAMASKKMVSLHLIRRIFPFGKW